MRDINIFNTDMFPYLEGEEIKGTTPILTINGIESEEMKSHAGKKETKEVLYFQETKKGFVLNKTNAKRIAQMYGAQTGRWEGKRITLTTEPVQAFGELHDALRVVPGVASCNPANGGMSLVKLLSLLKKVEVAGMATFYEFPDDILACRAKGAPLPAADDTEGWRVLFADARDYAIDRINEAIERGDASPDQLSMPEAMALTVPDKTDIDKVDEDKRADELWAALDKTAEADTTVPGRYFGEQDYGPKPPGSDAMDQIEAADGMRADEIDKATAEMAGEA